MTVVAQSYSATWNAQAIGNTVQGFEKAYVSGARPIQFDASGEAIVDMILNRMIMTVDFIVAEADAAAIDLLTWPWHATRGTFPNAGASLFALAKPLVLTSCGTVHDPATITFYKTILAPDFQTRVLYSHRERFIPIQLWVFGIKEGSESTPLIGDGCNDLVFFAETAQA